MGNVRMTIQMSVVEELTEMKRLKFCGVTKALKIANSDDKFAAYIEDWDLDPIMFGSRDISDICDCLCGN
jgi:hypothetical protein